jgi:uncharacterized protein YwgA
MEAKLIALKLVLDDLGIDSGIETVDDRKRVQKTIYLEQLCAIDLGYRFSWYLMGPYCPDLTQDYFALASDLDAGDTSYSHRRLKPNLAAKLRALRPLLSTPAGVPLSQESWLELLASYHYLRKVRGMSDYDAVQTLDREKRRVSPFSSQAKHKLEEFQLLS